MAQYKILKDMVYGEEDTLAKVGEIADLPEKVAIQFQTHGAVRPATEKEVVEFNKRNQTKTQAKVKSKTTKPEAKSKWQQDQTKR